MRLIVANQTLGGARLDEAVRERIERGAGEFYILVPMIEPQYETQVWAVADAVFAFPPAEEEVEEAQEEARRRSEHRLAGMLERIDAVGGSAEGEIGASDPFEAVRDLLGRRSFDEIIVSTLPPGISRWLKLDLPSRIARCTEIPVTTIEAEE